MGNDKSFWQQITEKSDYQALSPDDRLDVANHYVMRQAQIMAPRIGDDKEVKEHFEKRTREFLAKVANSELSQGPRQMAADLSERFETSFHRFRDSELLDIANDLSPYVHRIDDALAHLSEMREDDIIGPKEKAIHFTNRPKEEVTVKEWREKLQHRREATVQSQEMRAQQMLDARPSKDGTNIIEALVRKEGTTSASQYTFHSGARSWKEFFRINKGNKVKATISLIADTMAESSVQSAKGMAAGAGAEMMTRSKVVFAAAQGLAAADTEYKATFLSELEARLQQQGDDMTAESIVETLTDPEFHQAVDKKGKGRGAAIGTVEGLAGLFGRVIAGKLGTGTLGRTMAGIGAEGLIQSAGGGTGELVARIVTGDDWTSPEAWKDIGLEAFAELGQAGSELAVLPGKRLIEKGKEAEAKSREVPAGENQEITDSPKPVSFPVDEETEEGDLFNHNGQIYQVREVTDQQGQSVAVADPVDNEVITELNEVARKQLAKPNLYRYRDNEMQFDEEADFIERNQAAFPKLNESFTVEDLNLNDPSLDPNVLYQDEDESTADQEEAKLFQDEDEWQKIAEFDTLGQAYSAIRHTGDPDKNYKSERVDDGTIAIYEQTPAPVSSFVTFNKRAKERGNEQLASEAMLDTLRHMAGDMGRSFNYKSAEALTKRRYAEKIKGRTGKGAYRITPLGQEMLGQQAKPLLSKKLDITKPLEVKRAMRSMAQAIRAESPEAVAEITAMMLASAAEAGNKTGNLTIGQVEDIPTDRPSVLYNDTEFHQAVEAGDMAKAQQIAQGKLYAGGENQTTALANWLDQNPPENYEFRVEPIGRGYDVRLIGEYSSQNDPDPNADIMGDIELDIWAKRFDNEESANAFLEANQDMFNRVATSGNPGLAVTALGPPRSTLIGDRPINVGDTQIMKSADGERWFAHELSGETGYYDSFGEALDAVKRGEPDTPIEALWRRASDLPVWTENQPLYQRDKADESAVRKLISSFKRTREWRDTGLKIDNKDLLPIVMEAIEARHEAAVKSHAEKHGITDPEEMKKIVTRYSPGRLSSNAITTESAVYEAMRSRVIAPQFSQEKVDNQPESADNKDSNDQQREPEQGSDFGGTDQDIPGSFEASNAWRERRAPGPHFRRRSPERASRIDRERLRRLKRPAGEGGGSSAAAERLSNFLDPEQDNLTSAQFAGWVWEDPLAILFRENSDSYYELLLPDELAVARLIVAEGLKDWFDVQLKSRTRRKARVLEASLADGQLKATQAALWAFLKELEIVPIEGEPEPGPSGPPQFAEVADVSTVDGVKALRDKEGARSLGGKYGHIKVSSDGTYSYEFHGPDHKPAVERSFPEDPGDHDTDVFVIDEKYTDGSVKQRRVVVGVDLEAGEPARYRLADTSDEEISIPETVALRLPKVTTKKALSKLVDNLFVLYLFDLNPREFSTKKKERTDHRERRDQYFREILDIVSDRFGIDPKKAGTAYHSAGMSTWLAEVVLYKHTLLDKHPRPVPSIGKFVDVLKGLDKSITNEDMVKAAVEATGKADEINQKVNLRLQHWEDLRNRIGEQHEEWIETLGSIEEERVTFLEETYAPIETGEDARLEIEKEFAEKQREEFLDFFEKKNEEFYEFHAEQLREFEDYLANGPSLEDKSPEQVAVEQAAHERGLTELVSRQDRESSAFIKEQNKKEFEFLTDQNREFNSLITKHGRDLHSEIDREGRKEVDRMRGYVDLNKRAESAIDEIVSRHESELLDIMKAQREEMEAIVSSPGELTNMSLIKQELEEVIDEGLVVVEKDGTNRDIVLKKASGILRQNAKGFFDRFSNFIGLLPTADDSTILHESIHAVRKLLEGSPMGEELNALYGIKGDQWTRPQEERFARHFERYIRDGKVPKGATARVRQAFDAVKNILRKIYQTIKGSPIEEDVPSGVREFFDHLINRGAYLMEQAEQNATPIQQLLAAQTSIDNAARVSIAPLQGNVRPNNEVMFDVARELGLSINYKGTGEGAYGVYNTTNSRVSIRYQGDLDTTAHEISHAIDDRYGLGQHIVDTGMEAVIDTELQVPAFMSTVVPGAPPGILRAETLAEFIRGMMVNPELTRNLAPNMAAIYDQYVPQPVRNSLDRFGRSIRAWEAAPPTEQLLANVKMRPDSSLRKMANMVRGLKKANQDGFVVTAQDRFLRTWQDDKRPFIKAVDFIEQEQGQQPLPEDDPRLLARLFQGVGSKQTEIMETGMINARQESVLPGGVSWLFEPFENGTGEQLDRDFRDSIALMLSLRTIELAGRENRDVNLTGIGAGIQTDLDVAERVILELMQDPSRYSRLLEAGNRYQQWADANLRYLVEKGRLSEEGYRNIKVNNTQYVALNRIMEAKPGEEMEALNFGAGKGLGSVSEVLHRIYGSSRQIQNPYIALLQSSAKIVAEADRNEVMAKFVDFIETNRALYGGDPNQLASIASQVPEEIEYTIPIYRRDGNGEVNREFWQFDEDVYRALVKLGRTYSLPEIFTVLPDVLKWGVTNMPSFAIRNLIRDTQSRLLVSRAELGDNLAAMVPTRGDDTLRRLRLGGGDQAGYYTRSETDYMRVIEQSIAESQTDRNRFVIFGQELARFFSNDSDYRRLLERGEQANRLAEYKASYRYAQRELGYDQFNAHLYAAGQARDLMDFAVAGEWARWINQLLPFFNAAIQGTTRNIRAAMEDPATFAIRFAMFAVAPVIANRLLISMMDDDDEYEELPSHIRDFYWSFKIGPDLWLRIPKNFEAGVLASGFDRLYSQVVNKQEGSWDGYLGSLGNAVTPVDGASIFGPSKPFAEVIANYDTFRQKAIVSPFEARVDLDEPNDDGTRIRNSHRASRAGQAWQNLVESMGLSGWGPAKTFGDARKFDHLVKGLLANVGDTTLRATNIGREDTSNKLGIRDIGLFVSSPAYTSKSVQDVYNLAESGRLRQHRMFRTLDALIRDYYNATPERARERGLSKVSAYRDLLSKAIREEAKRLKPELEQIRNERRQNASR